MRLAILTAARVANWSSADHLSRLERQIAQLTGVVEGLRSDLSHLTGNHSEEPTNQDGQHRCFSDMQVDSNRVTQPTPKGDIISKGIVSEEEAVELFET